MVLSTSISCIECAAQAGAFHTGGTPEGSIMKTAPVSSLPDFTVAMMSPNFVQLSVTIVQKGTDLMIAILLSPHHTGEQEWDT